MKTGLVINFGLSMLVDGVENHTPAVARLQRFACGEEPRDHVRSVDCRRLRKSATAEDGNSPNGQPWSISAVFGGSWMQSERHFCATAENCGNRPNAGRPKLWMDCILTLSDRVKTI